MLRGLLETAPRKARQSICLNKVAECTVHYFTRSPLRHTGGSFLANAVKKKTVGKRCFTGDFFSSLMIRRLGYQPLRLRWGLPVWVHLCLNVNDSSKRYSPQFRTSIFYFSFVFSLPQPHLKSFNNKLQRQRGIFTPTGSCKHDVVEKLYFGSCQVAHAWGGSIAEKTHFSTYCSLIWHWPEWPWASI